MNKQMREVSPASNSSKQRLKIPASSHLNFLAVPFAPASSQSKAMLQGSEDPRYAPRHPIIWLHVANCLWREQPLVGARSACAHLAASDFSRFRPGTLLAIAANKFFDRFLRSEFFDRAERRLGRGFTSAEISYGGLRAMSSEAEEYRAKAEECEQLAAAAWDQNDKARYQELARTWRELAATVEILRRR
jgi:hypothetical protein